MEKEIIIERYTKNFHNKFTEQFKELMEIINWDVTYAGVISKALEIGIRYDEIEAALREVENPASLWSYFDTIFQHNQDARMLHHWQQQSLIEYNEKIFKLLSLVNEDKCSIDYSRAATDYWYVDSLIKEFVG